MMNTKKTSMKKLVTKIVFIFSSFLPMRYFFILLCLSIFSTPLAFATDTPPDSAVFSSDGTHWYVLNGGDLTLDTGKKVSYISMETPFYEGNSLYALASDESGKNKYILKDGVVIDQGQSAAFLQNYGTVTNLE